MRLKLLIEQAEAIAGGTRALARMLGEKNPGNVSQWKAGTKPCPEETQLRIAQIAGREPVPAVLEVAAERLGKLARGLMLCLAVTVAAGAFGALGANGTYGFFRRSWTR